MNIAYAIKNHESQGLTFEIIVIVMGCFEFAAGLRHDVLSRLKRLIDSVFIIYPDKKRFDRIEMSKVSKLRIEFLKVLHLKALGEIILIMFIYIYTKYILKNISFFLQN